ncbi:MAG: polyphenol oxidase family protein [Akkermansia sp.]
MMETPAFLKPIQSYPGEIVQFIERIPGVDVTGDRQTVLERLEPYHRAEVETLGWRWKDLRRAEQVHGTRVALVGDIGSNYPVEGVDGLLCSGVSDCVLAIYVADCAAVWLYDKENCHRSLIHSGKAGTAGNIVSNTIKSMKKCLGVEPSNLIAVISPASARLIMKKTFLRPLRHSSLKRGTGRTDP